MSLEENLQRFRSISAELSTLTGIQALLGWDQQVMMPVAASEERGQQLALIGGLIYDKSASDEVGKLLDELSREVGDLDADNDLAREIKLAKHSYEQATKVPKALMMDFITTTARSQTAWIQAKPANDYASFQPHLQRVIEISREMADCFKPWDHPYDALLDQYEPGMKTAEVQDIFNALRPRQIELLRQIASCEQVDDSFRFARMDVAMQRKLTEYVAGLIGYEWQRGRLDESLHPFTTNFGREDVRITTHFKENDGLSAFFSTMHETGHALYELGIDRRWNGTWLSNAASMSMHESQSRLWENLVGRSQPFWQFFYPTMQAFFPEALGNVSQESFYRGINKVNPSLIRIEADEASYNLHIMLRLELEIGMIEGKIHSRELPAIWNDKMEEYLGHRPDNDREGVLQDVHWPGGMIGYFSTYALGNLISAQLWEKMLQDQPSVPEDMAWGHFAGILQWLRENVHRHGLRYSSQDLVKRITGHGIDPDPYMRYLTEKYRAIYQF